MIASYLTAAMLLLAPAVNDGSVTLGLGSQPEFSAESSFRVPVSIGPLGEAGVAALQFDLQFQASQLRFGGVEAGSSAQTAEKSAQSNPLKPGTIRVIVAGLNRNTLTDGVIAWARFTPVPGAHPPFTVSLASVVLSDPFGTAVEAHAGPDTLVIDPLASVATASDTQADAEGATAGELLLRYRALLLAALFIGGAALIARRQPRKGRAR